MTVNCQIGTLLRKWDGRDVFSRAGAGQPGSRALSGLVIEVFRLNGDLIEAGDALVHDLGLTSARRKVLRAVALAPAPLPVAHIARNRGLARQSVQRVVDDRRADELVRLEPNPHHPPALFLSHRGHRKHTQPPPRWRALLTICTPFSFVRFGASISLCVQ